MSVESMGEAPKEEPKALTPEKIRAFRNLCDQAGQTLMELSQPVFRYQVQPNLEMYRVGVKAGSGPAVENPVQDKESVSAQKIGRIRLLAQNSHPVSQEQFYDLANRFYAQEIYQRSNERHLQLLSADVPLTANLSLDGRDALIKQYGDRMFGDLEKHTDTKGLWKTRLIWDGRNVSAEIYRSQHDKNGINNQGRPYQRKTIEDFES